MRRPSKPLRPLVQPGGAFYDSPTKIWKLRTNELTPQQVDEIRTLLFAAFEHDEHGGFTEDDWRHSVGGMHFLLEIGGAIVAHASVVERDIHIGGQPLHTGYVEAVATAPDAQRRGYGTAVMREVNDYVAASFELGALGTGSQGFYERLGWQVWRGPSFVRTEHGEEPTPDEDGYILVMRTPSTPPLEVTEPISCEWRSGDVW